MAIIIVLIVCLILSKPEEAWQLYKVTERVSSLPYVTKL
jgi:hypothetical protein